MFTVQHFDINKKNACTNVERLWHTLFYFYHSAVILCRQLVIPAADPNSAVLPMEGLEGTTNVPKPRRTTLHCLPQTVLKDEILPDAPN